MTFSDYSYKCENGESVRIIIYASLGLNDNTLFKVYDVQFKGPRKRLWISAKDEFRLFGYNTKSEDYSKALYKHYLNYTTEEHIQNAIKMAYKMLRPEFDDMSIYF